MTPPTPLFLTDESLQMDASKRLNIFLFLLFFISYSTYLFTAAPTLFWRDGSEFQTVGFTLGIAHPSGFPFYALAAKLFTLIPFGSIAFKTTLMSAFFGAVISLLIYLSVVAILTQLSGEKKGAPSSNEIHVIAFLSTILFSFSNALWENAIAPEVYTLMNAFTALFILGLIIHLKGDPHGIPRKTFQWFMGISFLFGLSLGAHSILILYLPFVPILIYFYWLRPNKLSPVKYLSVFLFFVILGISVYIYLPIRASQQPYFNWGYPDTFSQFIAHVTDKKDAVVHVSIPSPKSVLLPQMKNYWRFFPDNFSFLGIALGVAGGIYTLIKARRVAAILAVFYIPPFLFFIRFWGDSSNFLSGFMVFTLLIGVGAWWALFALSECVRRQQRYQKIIPLFWGVLGAGVLFLAIGHFTKNDRSQYWISEKPFKSALLDLESNSIVFARDSHFSFSYLQEVANIRPDVTHLSTMEFINSKVFFQLTPERFPLVTIPEVDFEELGPAFLSENIDSHPIYWEPDPQNDRLVLPYLSLDGAFYRVLDPPRLLTASLLNDYRDKLRYFFDPMKLSQDRNEIDFYRIRFLNLGAYLLKQGQPEIAIQHFQVADMLMPNDHHVLNLLGMTYARLKDVNLAEWYFIKILSQNPDFLEAQKNLGILYLSEMRYKEAEMALLKAKQIRENDVGTNYQLGLLYAQTGDDSQAIFYFKNTLREDPEHISARQDLKTLLGTDAEE
ncbi:MAG: DUF2723 domain-containing protein [Nitrospira sp.]|nr:DUF2723 domain-containing protein [Candidatus Manganitrophaceae bacterium]HIL35452.1 DUF2723 domain-containing protein [Candidatus Manganitrophaceae bacterium]